MAHHNVVARLLIGSAFAALSVSSVLAQTAPAPAAPADQASTVGIPDIIVTAQRRGQNLQKVPIAVTAASAETLGNLGVRSTADLGTIAPAVTFSTGLGGAAITVRGVGGTGSGSDESANAVYIDGVYMPSPAALLFQFNNIERVEVLKGPQGTLFGRNASGGLIQVITKDPGKELHGSLDLGYGNFNTFRGSASVWGGLTDTLAVSLAGVYENQGKGWGKNVATGNDAYKGKFGGARAKVVWQIDPDTKLTGTALYAYNRSANIQGSQILAGESGLAGTRALGFYDQSEGSEGFVRSIDKNYALTFSHKFDWATFTSITSRDLVNFRLVTDADLSPVPLVTVDINGPSSSWTQEFQLASPSTSRIQWIVGAFYYHNNLVTSPFRTIGLAFAPNAYNQVDAFQKTDSYAAYGQATVPVTDTTNITGGLRYTIDDRKLDGRTSNSNPAIAPTVFPTAKTTDKKLTWRLAVDQKIGDRVMAYASYSRGFKSGLYNSTNLGTPSVKPQTIDAYEIGFKSDLLDRHLRLNVSAFHYDLKDVQLRTILPSNPTPIFYNAARARIDGAEAEATVFINSAFSITGNVAYLSGKYRSFPNAVYYALSTPPAFGLTQLAPGNATGNKTVFTPPWVTNLSAQYKLTTSIGGFTLAGTWNYNSGYYFDPQNRVSNPSYNLVNGTLTWDVTKSLYARVWVNNIFKQKYYTVIQPSNFGDYYFPSAPRTFGVVVGAKF